MTNNEKYLWQMWERLSLLREMNKRGQVLCYVCNKYVNYTDASVRVVYNRSLPFSFIEENNYICCNDCKRPGLYRTIWNKKNKELKYNLRERIVYHQPVIYDDKDIEQAISKLARLIKNHDYERQTS